jgi:long-subunit fatty acid transport protein
MNFKKYFVICLLAQIVSSSYGQLKLNRHEEQTWFAYFNQTRISKRSGAWVDLHLRFTGDFFDHVGLSIARAGYMYYLTDQVKLTAAYAYANRYSTTGGPTVPEHRPWQQIQWTEKKKDFVMMQWIRLEERFRNRVVADQLTNKYDFNYRIRYNMAFTIPLKGKQLLPNTPFLFANNEVMINFGKQVVNNYFDQNRAFLGVGYQFTSHLNAQLGYMYIFQQLPGGNEYLNINAIRLFVFHNLDFRNKD